MTRLVAVLLVTACATAPQQPVTQTATQTAGSPAPVVDAATRAAIDRAEKLIAEDPGNRPYMYILATYYDRAHDVANVVRVLSRLHELHWHLGTAEDDFPNTKGAPEFRAIAAKLEAREIAVHRAQPAFTLPATVRSEGVAYDDVEGLFYYNGGKAGFVRVDRSGRISNLSVDPLPDKMGRLGMDVDPKRRHLWVVSASFDPAAPPEVKGRSGVTVYDLADGWVVRQVMHGSAEQPAFLNDMTLLADGTAFVTDSVRHQVVRLAPDGQSFETFVEGLRSPNGITVSADERTLYVADFRGINAIDVATRTRTLLETGEMLNGIDGLVEYRGALIGIQNVLGRARVVRVHVNENNRVELLESKNAQVTSPATGVVAGSEYYFMANLSAKDGDKVILKISL